MTKRIQRLVMTVAALAAMALGGAVFANAQTTTPAAPQQTAAPDRDNVQSGDQSTPDTGSASEAAGAESPETGAGSESGTANDGPGGHADPPGTANADHQFQGNE